MTLEGQTRPLAQPLWWWRRKIPSSTRERTRCRKHSSIAFDEAVCELSRAGGGKTNVADLFAAASDGAHRAFATSDRRTQAMAARVHLDDEVLEYVLDLIHFTRKHRRVAIGASPRASLALLHAARARALCSVATMCCPTTKALAAPVISHRLALIPEAEMEAVSPVSVVQEALAGRGASKRTAPQQTQAERGR